MNVVRQRLRRLGRTTGARTRSAVSDCVVRTVLFVPDPLKTEHRGDIRAESVCAGDWVVLRVVGVDGLGGLTAVEMVKYTARG